MKEALVVLMDKGHLKVYNLIKLKNNKMRIDLLKSLENKDGTKKLQEKMSDQSGRFGIGNGENHEFQREDEKRLLRTMAGNINNLIKKNNYAEWYFASEKSINNKIMKLLDEEVKHRLKENVAADLISLHKMELLSRFHF